MPKYAAYRHIFKYQTRNRKVHEMAFAVIRASNAVELELHPSHVEESIKRNGVADSQNCSGACLIQDSAEKFGHEVEGTVDFYPTRAFVVAEMFREPRRLKRGSKLMIWGVCHEYTHSSPVWKYNDSKGGQAKLLAKLRKEGPMKIVLRPTYEQDNSGSPKPGGNPRGPKQGIRKKRRPTLKGQDGRIAYALSALESVA